MPYVTVDIELDEFSDEELMEELNRFDKTKYDMFCKYKDNYSLIELEIMFEENQPAKAGINQLKLAI